MPIGGERGQPRDLSDETLQFQFQPFGKLDVLDRPTLDAHEMMMMAGQPFRHLVPGYAPGAVVGLNHSRLFQDRQ
jgi:hypothetical protein